MKVSVLFKPSQKSWITNCLTNNWFYNFDYKDFKKLDFKCKKFIIHWIPEDKIWEIYNNREKLFNQDSIICLCCAIDNLEF